MSNNKAKQVQPPYESVLAAAKGFTLLEALLLLCGSVFFVLDAFRMQDNTSQEPGWFYVMTMLLVLLFLPPTVLLWAVGLYMQSSKGKKTTLAGPMIAISGVGILALIASIYTDDILRSASIFTSLVFMSFSFYLIGKQLAVRYQLHKHASNTLITIGLLVGAYGMASLFLAFADTLHALTI